MNVIKNIVKQYNANILNNNLDESGADGFWDLAGEIARRHSNENIIDEYQDDIYQALIETYKQTKKSYL